MLVGFSFIYFLYVFSSFVYNTADFLLASNISVLTVQLFIVFVQLFSGFPSNFAVAKWHDYSDFNFDQHKINLVMILNGKHEMV
jgi:hypothetical protein